MAVADPSTHSDKFPVVQVERNVLALPRQLVLYAHANTLTPVLVEDKTVIEIDLNPLRDDMDTGGRRRNQGVDSARVFVLVSTPTMTGPEVAQLIDTADDIQTTLHRFYGSIYNNKCVNCGKRASNQPNEHWFSAGPCLARRYGDDTYYYASYQWFPCCARKPCQEEDSSFASELVTNFLAFFCEDYIRPRYPRIAGRAGRLVALECRLCAQRVFETGLRACGRCKRVMYCSAACQQVDWKRHKEECQRWYGEDNLD